MTELVIKIDLKDMLDHAIQDGQKPAEKEVIPTGYRCQTCWRDDGAHETTCEFYRPASLKAVEG